MPEPQKPATSDPWEQAAKEFKPSGETQSIPASGNDDWKIWQQTGGETPSQDTRPAIDRALQMTPHKMPHSMSDVGHEIGTAFSNIGAGGLHALTHPEELITGAINSSPPMMAINSVRDAYKHMTGQPNQTDQMAAHPLETVENAVGTAGALAGPELAGEGIGALRDPLRAYRSPAIAPHEAVARATADVLKPSPMAYRGIVKSLMDQQGNIKDFAQSTGNQFKTPLDFAKASTGAGQESSGFFHDNIIAPNAEVDTPHGTVGEVHRELGAINDRLRPSYLKKTEGAEMTALERQQLEARRDELNKSLYDTLSYRTGMPPEQIQALNQRGAQMQSVGDEADAAQAMRRQGYSGTSPSGLPLPMPMLERASRLVDYLRGGPEAVAGRKLQRIMASPEVAEPTPLPNPESLQGYRRMADQEDLGRMGTAIDKANANKWASVLRKPIGMGPTPRPELPYSMRPLKGRELEYEAAAQGKSSRLRDLARKKGLE